jgi:hypothetical protein
VDSINNILHSVGQGFVRLAEWVKALTARVASFAKVIFSREPSQPAPIIPGKAQPIMKSSKRVGAVAQKVTNSTESIYLKKPLKEIMVPYLKLKDAASLAQVSKTMHSIAQPAIDKTWEEQKNAITIDENTWKQIGLEVTDVPPLPKDIDAILKAECPFDPEKRVYQTHRLVLMPGGLSINKQGCLTRHLREGENESVLMIWIRIAVEKGSKEIEKPYWALVTANVIEGSRGKNFKDQKALIPQQKGYALATVLEAITCVTMNLEKSGEKQEFLLSEDPWTYTRCEEDIDSYPLVVGGFAPSGLFVSSNDYDNDDVGVVAVRRFF